MFGAKAVWALSGCALTGVSVKFTKWLLEAREVWEALARTVVFVGDA